HIQPSSIVLASLFLCFTGWRVYLVGIEPQEQVQLVALMRRNRFEDTVIGFNDSEMSPQPDIDERTAVQGQASHSEAGASGGSTRRYRRKRKHADVLERMADHIQQSSADQRKNVSEKLTQLGFDDEEVVKAILKFAESPNVYSHFWGLSDSQKIVLVHSII
ncbi:hypothetical protein HN51_007365, partial [Arachis hypogaea]